MTEELRENISTITQDKNLLVAILSSMIEGVVAVDSNERILMINQAASEMFNTSRDMALGRYVGEVLGGHPLTNLIEESLRGGYARVLELTPLSGKALRFHVAPIKESERTLGAAVVIHDITDLKKLERMRVEFVANVSHELKTPLASIQGFVETLKDGAIEEPKNARRFLSIIEKHTNRLNNLINDLLSLSKIESRETPIERKKIKLLALIKKVVTSLEDRIRQKNHSLKIETEEGLELYADEALLDQAVTNLLDNAIKYTPSRGKICISSRDVEGHIELAVSDNGIGIPEQDLPRIFERFYRVDKARSREMGGTGLGLAIVKHIMLAHGGSIKAESKLNQGSTFTLTFPKAK